MPRSKLPPFYQINPKRQAISSKSRLWMQECVPTVENKTRLRLHFRPSRPDAAMSMHPLRVRTKQNSLKRVS